MTLPTNLAAKIKAIPMDPSVLANDPELAYILSFSQHSITHESIYSNPRQSYHSPLETYQFADFDENTYTNLLEQSIKTYRHKNKQVIKGIRCGFKEYFARVAQNVQQTALKFMSREKNQVERKFQLAKEEEQYKIESLKGNNTNRWPESLKQFVKELNNLPWHAFSSDCEIFLNDFVEGAKSAIIALCKKYDPLNHQLQEPFKENLFLQIYALVGVILRTNNQSFILEHLKFIQGISKYLELSQSFQKEIAHKIYTYVGQFFKKIPQESATKYHCPQNLWNKEPFIIMKKIHFQKYNGLAYYTITTDSKYLYIYVSAINGGMFKIGTGQEGTRAGKIYLQRNVHFPIGTKVDQVNWVYIKGKIYLKTSSKDPWILEIINPETFNKEGNIQLFCPSLFGQQSLINLNKNTPLLTDGKHLFFLGNRIKIAKSEEVQVQIQPKDNKQKQKSKQKVIEQKKKQSKKKRPKKNEANPHDESKNQNYLKVLEIVLYQFSLDATRTYTDEDIDKGDIQELFDSFSGYFTMEECRRAFVLNDYDLAETCQWLFNQGEKQKDKNIKIYEYLDYVILAEAQITSNFQEKSIKSPAEIVTKEGSILNIGNISQSLWTMDHEQITCFSQNGVKIFSKNKKDYKKNPDTKLHSTLLKVLQSKFTKNPEYSIIYDPYNRLFYTFSWPQQGHFFPTVVLISADKKSTLELQQQRKMVFEIEAIGKLKQLAKLVLHHMISIQRSALRLKFRYNNWFWYYGQKIIEIGLQMNLPESDKKKLSNKRTKVLAKLNRINESEKIYEKNKLQLLKKSKVTMQVTKIHPFDAEGTIKNYRFICESFSRAQESQQQAYLFMICIQTWLYNSPLNKSQEQKMILLQIGQKLLRLKECCSSGKIKWLINRLIYQNYYLFYPTMEKQVKFLVKLSHAQLDQFLKHQSIIQRKEKDSILYEITKKEFILQKYEINKCDLNQIFKSKSNIPYEQQEDYQSIGNYLLNEAVCVEKGGLRRKEGFDETTKKMLYEYIQSMALESHIGCRFLQFTFLSSYKLVHDNCKHNANFVLYLSQLFTESFKILEKLLSKAKPEQLYNVLSTFIMIVQLYYGSVLTLIPQQEIITLLLKSLEHIQKPEFNQVYELIPELDFEGISPITEKLYESAHPLERGKNYNFTPKTFSKASTLLVDLDRKCQLDSNDSLNIQMMHEDCSVGNSIVINDGTYSSVLRLTGAFDTKKLHLLLGNSINIDFNSSGQVKDAQSLIRYGFKFAVRPIFSGKIKYSEKSMQKMQKMFGNVLNFEIFYNTLKYTIVAISGTIQNYLRLATRQTNAQINEILNGKIFRQGLQEAPLKTQAHKHTHPLTIINSFMQINQHDSTDSEILRKSNLKYWHFKEEAKEKVEERRETWNFEGIPSNLRSYLEQIKEFKGDFINVFTQARQLVKEKGPYESMMRKKSFDDKARQLWLQGEAILFLTILKHSGLLHLNLKFSMEYIKENLKAFEDARNRIYYSFISRMIYVGEWKDLIETYVGKDTIVEQQKKEEREEKGSSKVKQISIKRKGKPVRTMKIGQERAVVRKEKEKVEEGELQQRMSRQKRSKQQHEKEIRQRLSNNDDLIKGICKLKNIPIEENNQYETIGRIIEQIKQVSNHALQPDQSVYIEPIQHLVHCCLFLLKFKSPSTKQSLESSHNVLPLSLGRSLSSDNRNVDANKVNIFREWLQNWKKWKGFKKEKQVQLKFPVEQIVKFIISWIDKSEIRQVMQHREFICENRIKFYDGHNQLLKFLSNNNLYRYTLGSEALNLEKDYKSCLSSVNHAKLQELQQLYRDSKSTLKNIQSLLVDKLPSKLSKMEQFKNRSYEFIQKIRYTVNTLFLLENQNPNISLNLILYLIPFKFISNEFDDITYLVSLLVQKAQLATHENEEVLNLLRVQVGFSNIASRRWKDLFFMERVLFLLRKLQHNCRQKVTYQQKILIAEVLFYILYFIEVPLIARLALKIIKKLDINLKAGIKTPLEYEYSLFKEANKVISVKESFRLLNSNKNNVELLCQKINNIFHQQSRNELEVKYVWNECKTSERQSQERYNLVLNLHQEEDLYWFIKVLYYIEELEINSKEKTLIEFKSYEEYVQSKNKKKEETSKKESNSVAQTGQREKKEKIRGERIFTLLPQFKITQELQSELPFGWFYNYCNIFEEKNDKKNSYSKPPNNNKNNAALIKNTKNAKNNNQNSQNNKKLWTTPLFTKIIKKYEELTSKPLEEPKQGEGDEIRSEFLKAKNFFNRIKRYLYEITILIEQFSRSGYILFKEEISRERMGQICQIITLGSTNRLKDIQLNLKNLQSEKRLSVNEQVPHFTSKMQKTTMESKHYQAYDTYISYQNSFNLKSQSPNNQYTLLARKQITLQDSKANMPYDQFITLDQPTDQDDIEFGKQWIESGLSRMKKKYEKVYLSDYPNDTFYLGHGGIESGLRDNILIPANDSSLTLQTTLFDKILTQPKGHFNEQPELTDLPEELIQKISKIIEKGPIEIDSKWQIREFLLLTFYLKKLYSFDLQFIEKQTSKLFTDRLFKYIQHLQSYKELAEYKEDIQKLILKLVDNEHEPLDMFGHYLHDEHYHQHVQDFIVPLKLEKLNSTNEVKKETQETHSTVKSKYLLKSQPPQIELNKLLKYWEKNILPKIHQFVKSTLRPLEVDDFWEQMRRPLRINDHTEAKRVAYIICDNKLPAGAVLPDASHNWNSLELQQISVGDDVLVKLPKHKVQFTTPLLNWGNPDQKLAKIIFIDVKNHSVLIRYRVQQLGIFSYSWVPVNALMGVEKQVMHLSTKNIYQQLVKKLQGSIYIHAKQCLTKFTSSASAVDNIKLIKETILDLFIKNPISGCFSYPKPNWSMKAVFQNMLEDSNFAILDILEKQFCNIRGIDISLNAQKITDLNRFQQAKALIVSFKKQTKLAMCSGVRFYNDKYGYNEVGHVYTAKSERSDIEPMEFNEPNIYFSYYSNKECLPILEQNNYKIHPIEVTVFAIDDMWTIGCYIADVLCQIASTKPTPLYLEILRRINKVFITWMLKKSVSILCTYLAKLISKVTLTILTICEKTATEVKIQHLGLSAQELKELIKWINVLTEEESKEKVALYSALLQNLSEMVATILLKLPSSQTSAVSPPEHIKSQVQLIKMFKEIDSYGKLKKINLGAPNSPAYQWERILQISNIPDYFQNHNILNKVKQIIQNKKGKILCPAFDIYLSGGNCFILVDGWDVNELLEEEVIQKMQKQEEKPQQQEQNIMMSWMCPVCTYENAPDVNKCEMCETPMPIIEKAQQLYNQVQATDLKAAEKRLKERQANRFEEIKKEILQYFDDEYALICQQIVKKGKEAQGNSKNKQVFKKNKKGSVIEIVRPEVPLIPEKPMVQLTTGSKVFESPIIEEFLELRFRYLPHEIRGLVDQEQKYLLKFRKLLSFGFDLWGDNVFNENPALIPFHLFCMLMDYVQSQICKGSSSVLSYSEESIRILSQIPLTDAKINGINEEPINYLAENDMGVRVKYKQLAQLKSYSVRYSWKLVKELNLAVSKCLQFINMDLAFDKQRNDASPVFSDPLGYKIKHFKNLIMGVIKLQLFQKVMQKTSVGREKDEQPKIELERMKFKDVRTKEGIITSKEKEDHLLTKAHQQFLKISPAFLRPFKPKGTDPYLSFIVTFKGENAMGQAGPYRQFFTDVGRELSPTYNLGLFVPTPNNRHQEGEFKSKWIINPKANSTYHFSLYEFIGILMGCCIRTGGHIALDLPRLFWKSITHEEISQGDLQEVDTQLVRMIKMLKDCPSEQALEEATDNATGEPLSWTYNNFNGELSDIIPNGKNVRVEFHDLQKYIDTLKSRKINETKLQIKRIIQGMSQLIPLPFLHCLTAEELQLIICGRPRVEVDLLKKHTKYSGGLTEESRRIKFFWQMMRELSEEDRLKIIKFCWGQERLPINSQQFERNNIRFMIKPMISNIKNQDQALPKADTCFFNIELPDYSSKDIMQSKVMLAVNLDNVSINADEVNSQENPLMNEIDHYDQQGEENQEQW